MTLQKLDQLLSLVAACACKTGGCMTLRKSAFKWRHEAANRQAFVGCGPTPATFTLSKDSSGDIASIASGYGCVVEQISGPGTGISIAWNNFTFTTADGLNGTLSEQRTQNEGSNVTIETYNGTLTKDLDASVDMGLVADAGGDADATVVGTLVGD